MFFAALSTCDPGNVMDAVKAAKEKGVRVSIVGVAAEVHICRVFTKVGISHLLPPLLCAHTLYMSPGCAIIFSCPVYDQLTKQPLAWKAC